MEYDALTKLAAELPVEVREQLLADAAAARVRSDLADGSRLVFEIPGYDRPKYQGQRPYASEGRVRDADGTDVDVLIYADQNGRLLELELIRWGEGDLMGPDWATFVIRETG